MDDYAKHIPSQLSGGQQQRVAIARALVSSSELIILDEPITNLDLKLRESMLEEIREIQQSIGTTIIYITHDQEASLQICDRLAIIDNQGDIRQIGNDYDIVMNPKDKFVFEFIGISNYIPVKNIDNAIIINTSEGNIKIDENAKVDQAKHYDLAVRPTDIEFDEASPLKVRIDSSTFLGNVTNYFASLGDKQIRIQQSALDVLETRAYKENEVVGIKFLKKIYYEREEA